MRKVFSFAFLFLILFSIKSNAQLSGTKSIPGDYATILDAVTALNAAGVGSGGVTFQVAAGHTELTTAPINIKATGTAVDPIIFIKNGAGSNPLITRTDGGSLSTSTLGAQGDAVIILDGSDYVRFDGIDVATSLQGIEYGYYLRKANTDDGCKYVTIQNCNIDMTKGTSSYVVGIYSSNNDSNSTTSSATGITLTSTGGRHENVTIINNSVESVFVGILIRGHNDATAPYDYYDQNFTVGMNGAGNTIANFGGNASATCYGIYVIYHDGQRIVGNSVNNTVSPFTATGYGIFNSTSYNSDITIDSNIVEVFERCDGLKYVWYLCVPRYEWYR